MILGGRSIVGWKVPSLLMWRDELTTGNGFFLCIDQRLSDKCVCEADIIGDSERKLDRRSCFGRGLASSSTGGMYPAFDVQHPLTIVLIGHSGLHPASNDIP